MRPQVYGVLLLAAVVAAPLLGWAADKAPPPPRTAEEHLATAKSYKEKSDSARRDAERHRTMIDRYFNAPGGKAGVIQDEDKWYLEHCNRFIEQANALSTTATDLAAYHEKKAEEVRKKPAR